MGALTISAIVLYLLVLGYLGYRGYSQTHTATDYLLAGRTAHPIVMALSYGATFISTSAIVGFGGVAANLGMGLLWLTFLNIFVGVFIAFVFLGGRTRRMGHHLDAHTFPDLIGKRFDSNFIQVFSGLVIFLFMPLYAMAVMNGAAEFIASSFHIHFDAALAIFAVIVAAYVIMGGLKSVMLNDALQGAIMLAGLIIMLVVTYVNLGGVTEAHTALTELEARIPDGLRAAGHQGWTSMPKFGWGSTEYNLWWVMVSTIIMGVGIGVLAQPQLVVRFMTVKSQRSLNRAVAMGGIFIFFVIGTIYIVGPLSNVFFAREEAIQCKIVDTDALLYPDPEAGGELMPVDPQDPEEIKQAARRFVSYRLPGEGAEHAPHYVLHTEHLRIERGDDGLSTLRPGLIAIRRTIGPGTSLQGNQDSIVPIYVGSAMPRWFGLVFLLTLLSAGMSTVSSQFHTIGTSIGYDVFRQAKKGKGGSVAITRIGIAVGIIVAIVLGKAVRGNVIALATAIFFGLCAAAFLPMFIGAIFWKRMTKAAAMASMLTGFCVSLFWLVFINGKVAGGLGFCQALFGRTTLVPEGWSATWNVVDPLFVALPASAVVAVVVSLLTRPPDQEHVDYCFGGPKPVAE